jgi:hypothetical protein
MRHLSKGVIPSVWNLCFMTSAIGWRHEKLFLWRQPLADVTKNSFYDVSHWLTSRKTLFMTSATGWRHEKLFFVTRQFASSWRHEKSRYKISKSQTVKGNSRKETKKRGKKSALDRVCLLYLLCSQEERKKRVHCANTVSCMQPFSPGPCRFGLDSIKALKMSGNMPTCRLCVMFKFRFRYVRRTTVHLPFCARYHFANVVLLLIIAKKALNEIAMDGAKIYILRNRCWAQAYKIIMKRRTNEWAEWNCKTWQNEATNKRVSGMDEQKSERNGIVILGKILNAWGIRGDNGNKNTLCARNE